MFWRVAGLNQSPIELILDKDEFTLEDILDEDSDLVQECKSLNGRLVAFLRERGTVEQLIRYLVDPPLDADDPKRAYKYPFTACEVLCCEVEAVFNTLLEDAELMQLLFSLLGSAPPLSSKTAGYFGRVVGHLLLRKTNEMMQYLQEHPDILQQLVRHVDTTSIAEIVKRLVGADEQPSVLFLAQYAPWLAETPLVEQLLARLAEDNSPDAQGNAADILCAIAHTQPSPIASKLTRPESIAALFQHALAPGHQVLVPALDVCIALIEPRRSTQAVEDTPNLQEAAAKAKLEAVEALIQYVPSLVEVLRAPSSTQQEAPYGLLSPTLGRTRLKAAELLAVLLRNSTLSLEPAITASGAVQLCLQLFASHPFNNLLHHCVAAMLVAILDRGSPAFIEHLFEECRLLDWLLSLPTEIRPTPVPGQEEVAASKPLLRAGYLGHITRIASMLESFAGSLQDSGAAATGQEGELQQPQEQQQPAPAPNSAAVSQYLERSPAWQAYVQDVLHPRQELENTSHWACGRPTATELARLDSEADEYQQAEMELEHMVGMQPVMYHRYHEDDGEDEDDEEDHGLMKGSTYGTQAVTDGISNIDLNDVSSWQEAHMHLGMSRYTDEEKEQGIPGIFRDSQSSAAERPTGMEDDAVVLANSDDEGDDDTTEQGSPTLDLSGSPGNGGAGPLQLGSGTPPRMQAPLSLSPGGPSAPGEACMVDSYALPASALQELQEPGSPENEPAEPSQDAASLTHADAAEPGSVTSMAWQPSPAAAAVGSAERAMQEA